MQWPFKNMKLGETVVIWDVMSQHAAAVAHTVGRYKGWSFKTETVKEGNRRGIKVTRVPGKHDVAKPKGRRADFVEYGYEKLEVGESITITGDPEYVGRAINGIQHRQRVYGIYLSFKSKINPETRLYESVTVTRID